MANQEHALHTWVPAELHMRIKLRATKEGRRMQDVIRDALEAYLIDVGEE